MPSSLLGTRKSLFVAQLLLLVLMQSNQDAPRNTFVQVPRGRIDITLPSEKLTVKSEDLMHWIKSAANAISLYYGHFPVRHLTLRVGTDYSDQVHHGVTYPKDGGLIVITVGRNATVSDLKDDWVLPHEMIHLAFPSMDDNHHWIEEGISTYVEPIARVQAGQLPAAQIWREFVMDMPKGQPAWGDRGLDNTPTWGRTYWGGALFCLVADVRIRERTHNRKGLQDALRGIVNGGGAIDEDWEIEKAFAMGDRATGTTVLRDLYGEMRDKPAPVDLDQLWHKLGMEFNTGQVSFNDRAPEAAIRLAITAPRSQRQTPQQNPASADTPQSGK